MAFGLVSTHKKKVNVFVASLTQYFTVYKEENSTDTNVHRDIEDKHKLSCKKRQFYSLSIDPYIFVKNIYIHGLKLFWKWH